MSDILQYKPRVFDLSGLSGISDKTLEMHFHLYEGYVTNTNNLNEKISDMIDKGKIADSTSYSVLKRHLGFEYNGMVLHEYYFENMQKQGNGEPERQSSFYKAAMTSFGTYDNWKADFVGVGAMRGVGWAICYQDPRNGNLSNHWITLHEDGNIAGFTPVLVMDVWEHAFLLDYKPAERSKYIEAFFSNISWSAVENRLLTAGTSLSHSA